MQYALSLWFGDWKVLQICPWKRRTSGTWRLWQRWLLQGLEAPHALHKSLIRSHLEKLIIGAFSSPASTFLSLLSDQLLAQVSQLSPPVFQHWMAKVPAATDLLPILFSTPPLTREQPSKRALLVDDNVASRRSRRCLGGWCPIITFFFLQGRNQMQKKMILPALSLSNLLYNMARCRRSTLILQAVDLYIKIKKLKLVHLLRHIWRQDVSEEIFKFYDLHGTTC